MSHLLIYSTPLVGVVVFLSSPGWVLAFLGHGTNSSLSALGMISVFAYGAMGLVFPFAYSKAKSEGTENQSLTKLRTIASVLAFCYILPPTAMILIALTLA